MCASGLERFVQLKFSLLASCFSFTINLYSSWSYKLDTVHVHSANIKTTHHFWVNHAFNTSAQRDPPTWNCSCYFDKMLSWGRAYTRLSCVNPLPERSFSKLKCTSIPLDTTRGHFRTLRKDHVTQKGGIAITSKGIYKEKHWHFLTYLSFFGPNQVKCISKILFHSDVKFNLHNTLTQTSGVSFESHIAGQIWGLWTIQRKISMACYFLRNISWIG